jgi:hypothetical protein
MIVQLFKNSKTKMLFFHNKSYSLLDDAIVGYDFIGEAEGYSWLDCCKKLYQEHFFYNF